MRLSVGAAASVAAKVLARPEYVTICKIQKYQQNKKSMTSTWENKTKMYQQQ